MLGQIKLITADNEEPIVLRIYIFECIEKALRKLLVLFWGVAIKITLYYSL